MKKEIGKWQMVFQHGRSVQYYDPFVRQFTFGIFKLKYLPLEGVRLNRKYYTGFMINIIYKFPIAKG